MSEGNLDTATLVADVAVDIADIPVVIGNGALEVLHVTTQIVDAPTCA